MPKDVKYGQWSEEDMKRALAVYKVENIGLNEVCRQYGISKSTFYRHLIGTNIFAKEEKKVIGKLCDLKPEVEKEIVKHVLKLEESFFGITTKDFRKLAFDVAEINHIVFLKKKKRYRNFMRRNPTLSLRLPRQ